MRVPWAPGSGSIFRSEGFTQIVQIKDILLTFQRMLLVGWNGTLCYIAAHRTDITRWSKLLTLSCLSIFTRLAILRRFKPSGEFISHFGHILGHFIFSRKPLCSRGFCYHGMIILCIWLNFSHFPPLVEFSSLKSPSRHMRVRSGSELLHRISNQQWSMDVKLWKK